MQIIEKPLSDVADVLAGVNGLASNGSFSYTVIQPTSFSDCGVISSVIVAKRDEGIPPEQMLQAGDVLVKRLNPSYVYVVEETDLPAVASPNLLVVRPKQGISSLYIGYLLEQKEIIEQIAHVSGNSSAIKAISVKKLAAIPIPIIPEADQVRVGEIWRLTRTRRLLLQSYLEENDKIMTAITSKILRHGGHK